MDHGGVPPMRPEVVLEEEFGEDLYLSSEEESIGGEEEPRPQANEGINMLSFRTRRHSTSQLFTTSTSRHFREACARFASRRQYRRMAECCNRAAWKAGAIPSGIRSLKAVDMAWRCNLLEEALAMFYPPLTPKGRRSHARRAKEVSEEELAAEVREAEQQCVQEENDVRLLEGDSRRSKVDLLNDEELERRARETLCNSEALVTRAAVKEFSTIMELWTKDLVIDILRYEQERRWARVMAVKTPYVHIASINAALSRRGLPLRYSSTTPEHGKGEDIQDDSLSINDASWEGEGEGEREREREEKKGEENVTDSAFGSLSTDHGWLPEELLKLQNETQYI